MIYRDKMVPELLRAMEKQLGGTSADLEIPPPVFFTMGGEFVELDTTRNTILCRFPVLHEFLNPYATLQGGMIAAAIDNTIGPLSLVVASPSFTRRLEIVYKKSISAELGHIEVTARFIEQKKRMLYFDAEVRDCDETVYATAQATHWIVDNGKGA